MACHAQNDKYRVDRPFVVWLTKPEVDTMTMQSNANQQQIHKVHKFTKSTGICNHNFNQEVKHLLQVKNRPVFTYLQVKNTKIKIKKNKKTDFLMFILQISSSK